jgi:hypothetical protein
MERNGFIRNIPGKFACFCNRRSSRRPKVNVKGQKGNNISLDLRLEHLNHIFTEMLRNLGPNFNEVTAACASHSLNAY